MPRTCSPYAHKHPTVTIPSSESHKSKLVNFSSPIQSSLSETSHSINEEVLHMEEHPPEAHEHSCSTGNNGKSLLDSTRLNNRIIGYFSACVTITKLLGNTAQFNSSISHATNRCLRWGSVTTRKTFLGCSSQYTNSLRQIREYIRCSSALVSCRHYLRIASTKVLHFT